MKVSTFEDIDIRLFFERTFHLRFAFGGLPICGGSNFPKLLSGTRLILPANYFFTVLLAFLLLRRSASAAFFN
jgi:hypothetical protein